ncbi:MAG: efflux RND transporter permease subunit [Desulfobacteraceae bacterium]|nr:efflux RND transporter permease subunit [Desulfobacteraceae bacterium]MBC2756211.1 efflux RND transporter permease subunit [Desulfobacteraceae bacterium]
MNITEFAIRNNRLTYFLVLLLVLFGINAYFSLPKAEDPGFTIRTAVVTAYLPGASPERVEQLVTDKVEQVIQQMPELDNVSSDTQTGVAVIFANFKQSYKNMRPIFDDLRRKVETVKKDLPEGVSGPFVNDEYGDVFGVVYTLTGDGFNYGELKTVADKVRDELLLQNQVAKVEIHGDQEEVVFVDYSNARLQDLGLSPQQLRTALQSINILSSGGDILIGRERITLEPTGNFESLKDIRRALVNIPGTSDVVYLEDIAHVYRSYKDPRESAVHSIGRPALAITVSMKEGGNILELGKTLKEIMPTLQSRYPHGIEFETIAFQPKMVDRSIDDFMKNLLQAVAIVFIVMLAFLGLRTGVVVAALIPSVMAITFVVMQWFDVGINKMSLAALIISLGLLVDNGIVMAEGILVRLERGQDKIAAAVATGKEMLVPLLTSSLTTSAAFLPILLAQSAVGEFTGDIARVVSMALILSWLLAMTLVPLLAVHLIKVKRKTKDKKADFSGIGYRFYRMILRISLQFKPIFLIIIVVLFILGIKGLGLVPKAFIPSSTAPIVNAKFDMPVGTSIETTEKIAYDIENFLLENWLVNKEEQASGKQGVLNWMTFIGVGAPRFVLGYDPGSPSERHIALVANTTDYRMIPELSKSVENFTKEKYPDLQIQLRKLENGPPVEYPIQIRLLGKNLKTLYGLADEVKSHFYTLPQIASVNDDWGPQIKKLMVIVDQERAQRAGVTSEDVAVSLEASLSGTDLTYYREGDNLIPVTLRSVAADRNDLGKMEGITIYSSGTGLQVPFKQVADIEMAWQPGLIKRRDRLRAMMVNVQLKPGITATEVNNILLPWLDKQSQTWPSGYRYQEGGEAEASGDAMTSLVAGMPLAGMLIVLLLVGQFNSIRRPFIILLTIPLGLIGISAGLIIANSIFGFFTLLALVSLAGIIINNAIVLLDRIRIEITENGLLAKQAIYEACQQRLRPIVLTTATTVGGMLPLWLSHDPMFETMAVSIIFGLMFATILTLVFVPVMYSLLFRVSFKDG